MDATSALKRVRAEGRRGLPSFVPWVVGLSALLVFEWLRIAPHADWYHRWVEGTAAQTGPWMNGSLGRFQAIVVLREVVVFVAAVLPGVLLARDGARRSFWVPALSLYLLIITPVSWGWLHLGVRDSLDHVFIDGSMSLWTHNGRLRAAVELTLILAPAILVAFRTPRRSMAPIGRNTLLAWALIGLGWLLVAMWDREPYVYEETTVFAAMSFAVLWDVRSWRRLAGVFVVAGLITVSLGNPVVTLDACCGLGVGVITKVLGHGEVWLAVLVACRRPLESYLERRASWGLRGVEAFSNRRPG